MGEPSFAKMAPSLVAFVDDQGVGIGRNGSALMRGDNLAKAYLSLGAALKSGRTASAVWINRERQEQLLASFTLHNDSGAVVGALVIGTPLNDERLSRTSDLTSGYALIFELVTDKGAEIVAKDGRATSEMVSAASSAAVAAAAKAAITSHGVVKAEGEFGGYVLGAMPLEDYGDQQNVVLVAAVPALMVESLGGLLWPILAVGLLGLLLVGVGGMLLGNYISQPVSELEDGLLAIINGSSDLRFQIEHDELGGLVFRINSLLNALMGVPEDNTDDQGGPPRRRATRVSASKGRPRGKSPRRARFSPPWRRSPLSARLGCPRAL